VVGVLEKDGAVGLAVNRGVVALFDEDVRFLFFFHLAINELNDVRMVDIEDNHLGGAARLAAALDDAGEGVEALHEADGAGGDAATGESLAACPRRVEKLVPVPEPHLKSMPSVRVRAHDGFHAVLHGVE